MTVAETYRRWLAALAPRMGEGEAKAVAREAFGHFLGLTPVDIALKGDDTPGEASQAAMADALRRVEAGEPVQYVTGEAWFNGLKIKVTPAVLIPRPETSQLVDMIADRFAGRRDLRVIDLCSGSGAIALALARRLPFASVTGVELMPGALEVARENAGRLKCNVEWIQADVLRPDKLPGGVFDIIVSNPPYIPECESGEIDPNVWNHEPREALLVPDSNPTVFYKAIAGWAARHLSADGALFFEINPRYAREIERELKEAGFTSTETTRDIFGKERFVTASL